MDAENDVEDRARSRVGIVLREKWRLDALLGVGGMASIYAATHRNLKKVAVKILHHEYSSHPEARARFLREGYVANSLGHPGVVIVDDDDVTDEGDAFLVMELLEGETLHARWERKGRKLGLRQVLSYADELLDVLVAAHAKGIVHRDVKPENLFLTTAKTLKVLDFGIARVREAASGATKLGSVMGTPAFMAPEQARGRWDHVDGQTDLWAVGATMYTLLSGRHVHEAETPNEQLALACTQDATTIAAAVTKLPPRIVQLIDRALAYDKANRWPDAAAMQAELRSAFSELRSTFGEPKPAAPTDARASSPSYDIVLTESGAIPRAPDSLPGDATRIPIVEQDPIERTSEPPVNSRQAPTVMRTASPTTAGVSIPPPRSNPRSTVLAVLSILAAALVIGLFMFSRSTTAPAPAAPPPSASVTPAASGDSETPIPSASADDSRRGKPPLVPWKKGAPAKSSDKKSPRGGVDSATPPPSAPPPTPPPPAADDSAKAPPKKPKPDVSDLGF